MTPRAVPGEAVLVMLNPALPSFGSPPGFGVGGALFGRHARAWLCA